MTVILASVSAARRHMMARSGFVHDVVPAKVDEDAIKDACRSDAIALEETALALALAKAKAVSRTHRKALVIGSDQMLLCEGRWFDKPSSLDDAHAHLAILQGKSHKLVSAVCVVQNQTCLWSFLDEATLTMKPMTDSDISAYLDAAGEAVLGSVGCYQLENGGAALFSGIEGDRSVILGMPVMALVGFLDSQGCERQ